MFKHMFKSLTTNALNDDVNDSQKQLPAKDDTIYKDLEKNLNIFKSFYNYPNNNDIVVRKLIIGGSNISASIFFIDSITDPRIIDEQILSPLLLNTEPTKPIENIVSTQINTKRKIRDILDALNNGGLALFVDGDTKAYTMNVANFQSRDVEKSENEIVLKGSKEAFIEESTVNISLIRKHIRNENLVFESKHIGERTNNNVYIAYIKNLANEDILKEVKNRIDRIDTDSILNLATLEQYIEDNHLSLFSTLLYTERPDRTASYLEDGYIALVMDNSPSALILPVTFWSFFHTSEDNYLRFINANFIRLLRLGALFVTIFTSAFYIAVTEFHAELLPPDLLLAIASTREIVPFPPLIEILLMEFSFELIREAGLRVPAPIGPTIGIVGALILGQAAVEANIVSPVIVIVVALSGLSSFAVGDLSLNFAVRIIRFLLIFASTLFGIYGIMSLFTVGVLYVTSIRSFGVPYMAPLSPSYTSSKGTYSRRLLTKQMFRPGYLKPKDITKK